MNLDSKKRNIIIIVLAILSVLIWSIHIFLKIKKSNDLKKNIRFPPWPSKCPDYWKVDDNTEDGPICSNPNKIGLCNLNGKTADFTDAIFRGSKGSYYKCNWSKKCNVPWEGIDSLC